VLIKPLGFSLLTLVLACLSGALNATGTISPLYRPLPGLTAKQLAVVVNDADPLSVHIADYYQSKRHIPQANILHLRFDPFSNALSQKEFAVLKQKLDAQTPNQVQAFVLTWLKPFRVDCMSITTAFAAGFDQAFCAKVCEESRKSPYFASNSQQPFTDLHWRPTMSLAGHSFEDVKRLIDRGITADFTYPQGSAYLLKTTDQARSSRAIFFPEVAKMFAGQWPVHYLEQDTLENKTDVMFYFTGLAQVPNISKNTYLPGAIADHLTSAGGVLTGGGQMNILEWIKAGATASYGAVIEPCNYPAKFSNPAILLHFYLRGNSLIEAYWKSVLEPGQGIFVGEPLARPFASSTGN
jgi:uncharacterized protein (TIGR03790 family)